MAAQGGDRAGAAQQGTGGGAVMRPQRRRQLEQWLGPYLSDRGGSQTDRRGFNLRSRVEKNCSHSDTWKGDRSKIWWWYPFSGRETPKFVLFFCVRCNNTWNHVSMMRLLDHSAQLNNVLLASWKNTTQFVQLCSFDLIARGLCLSLLVAFYPRYCRPAHLSCRGRCDTDEQSNNRGIFLT